MTVPDEVPVGSERRFEILRRLGAGTFGEVYLAEMVSGGGFRREVALKVLNAEAERHAGAARRMRDEARILGRLSHRNIVEVLDLIPLQGRWAVVMEHVPGAGLDQIIDLLADRGRTFEGRATCAIGVAVARALHAAATASDRDGRPLRVVHRDIKPSNVRVTADGEVKVLDFGVARVELEGREAKTRGMGLMGTERYMSPERLLLESDGPPGDVYALGATLVELIRGEPLGRSPVREEAHARFVADALTDAARALQGPPGSTEALIAWLGRCLDADPLARPTAGELAEALDALGEGWGGPSLAAAAAVFVPRAAERGQDTLLPLQEVWVEGAATPAPAVTPPALPRRERRATTIAAGVGVAALLAFGAAGVGQIPSASPPAAPPVPDVAGASPVLDVAGASPVLDVAGASPVPAVGGTAPAVSASPPASSAPRAASKELGERPRPDASAPAGRAPPLAGPPPGPTPPPGEPRAGRVTRALVAVPNVDAIEVACGGQRFHGTASVRLADFPAGDCTVRAGRAGAWREATVTLLAPREVRCAYDEELACR